MTITKPKLYRDDDINVFTDAFKFKELHEYFLVKGKLHIAAVIMKDLWDNHALFYYLATEPLLKIGLHGWEHKDYSKLSYEVGSATAGKPPSCEGCLAGAMRGPLCIRSIAKADRNRLLFESAGSARWLPLNPPEALAPTEPLV